MWKTLWLVALLAGSHALASEPPAEVPQLDELEQQLKRQQAAEAQRQAAEAQRRAREASMARLVVEADVPCDLRIDGEAKGRVVPGEPRTVLVVGGEQLIECASVEFPAARARQVREVAPAAKLIVSLILAEGVAVARREAEAAAHRESLEARFEVRPEGVFDVQQGVVWSAADNGTDINWTNAIAYCEAKGSEWRLPSVAELQSLYDETGAFARTMQYGTIKPATSRIGFSGYWYWSAEANGSSGAWGVFLGAGIRYSCLQSGVDCSTRALCVRRP